MTKVRVAVVVVPDAVERELDHPHQRDTKPTRQAEVIAQRVPRAAFSNSKAGRAGMRDLGSIAIAMHAV